ncbi:hypothetical protein C8Q75DRAFT_866321 [Abortiporus biennis]|nr:hypothetical protein C8Q75DRAFT_866321 [Abortiporus biennis]
MSKLPTRKQQKPNRKLTDFFQPRSSQSMVMSSPQPSSSRLSSPPSSPLPNESTRLPSSRDHPSSDLDVISISDESHIVVSPLSKSHISVSSGTHSVIDISSNSVRSAKSSDSIQILSASRCLGTSKAPREYGAQTSVRRRPPLHLSTGSPRPDSVLARAKAKRKFSSQLDNNDEALPDQVNFPSDPSVPATTPVSQHGDSSPGSHVPSPISPSKRARMHSPERTEPRQEGQVPDEEVPSSQSDEQELVIKQPIVKTAEEVRSSIEEWRARTLSSVVAAEPSQNDHSNDHDIGIPMEVDDSPVQNTIQTAVSSTLVTPEQSVEPQAAEEGIVTTENEAGAVEASVPFPTNDSPEVSVNGASNVVLRSPQTNLPSIPEVQDPATKAAQRIAEIKSRVYGGLALSDNEEDSALSEPEDLTDSDEGDDMKLSLASMMKQAANKNKHNGISARSSPSPPPLTGLGADDSRRYNFRTRLSPSEKEKQHTNHLLSTQVSKSSTSKKANPLDSLLREKRLADKKGKGEDALRSAEAAVASQHHSQSATDFISQLTDNDGTDTDGDDGDEGAEEDCEKFLGKDGKAVKEILAQDKLGEREVAQETAVYKVAWASYDEYAMVEDICLPPLSVVNNDAEDGWILLLAEAVQNKDLPTIQMLLHTDCIEVSANANYLLPLIEWLNSTALMLSESSLSYSAFTALCSLVETVSVPLTVGLISSSIITSSLLNIGVKCEILKEIGWELRGTARARNVPIESRPTLLVRFSTILSAMARRQLLDAECIPKLLTTLLLLAIDPMTEIQAAQVVRCSIQHVGEAVTSSQMETSICDTALPLLRGLSLNSQVQALSALGRGVKQTAHIASWIAYLLLFERPSILDYCAKMPDLDPIVKLVHPTANSEEMFDFNSNADKNGYFRDLALKAQILGITLTGLKVHVVKNESQQQATIKDIGTQLKELHSKINDTRAAHLDRSSVKATLQQLSFRLAYQMKHQSSRLSTLKHYFTQDQDSD